MSKLALDQGFHAIRPSELPVGWLARQLSELVEVRQGGKLGLTKEKDYSPTGIPAFSAAGCDGFVERSEYKNTSAVILSSIGANCGRCFFASGDWTTLANVQAIIPNYEIDAKFLFYRVNQPNYWTRSGSAQPFIKPSSIKKSWVAFPSNKAQQRKIATILSTIDSTIEQTEALIEKYQHIKVGMMHDLFTRGVLPNGQLRPPREQAPELYQETVFGWIPKEWGTKPIREVTLEIGDGVHYSVTRSTEGIPFLFVSCVRNGQIDWDSAARITLKTYLEISKKCKPYQGMILLTAVGSYGHVAYVHAADAFGFERNIAYLKPNTNAINPKYLYHWLASHFSSCQIERLVIGNAQKVLTLGNIGKICVALPDENEQRFMADMLDAEETTLSVERNKLEKLKFIKLGLMQDLLTGKVAVKLDVEVPEMAGG